MPTNIKTTKAMKTYAKAHGLKIPKVSTVNPFWGKGKRTLAWRVSGHAKIKQSTKKTQALCDLLFPPTFGQLVVRAAMSKLGVHEKGSTNTGYWVDKFLKAVYLPGGYAWCAAFASWSAIRAALKDDAPPDTYDGMRDVLHDLMYGNAAYVPNWYNAAKAKRSAHGWRIKVVSASNRKAGDFVIEFGTGHIEILRKRAKLGIWYQCIGGNTSPDNSGSQTNGGQVCKKLRTSSTVTAFVRLVPPK